MLEFSTDPPEDIGRLLIRGSLGIEKYHALESGARRTDARLQVQVSHGDDIPRFPNVTQELTTGDFGTQLDQGIFAQVGVEVIKRRSHWDVDDVQNMIGQFFVRGFDDHHVAIG